MTIKDRLIDFFADLIPYLNTSASCLFATASGIAFFSYDGESRLTAAALCFSFVFTLATALYCVVQTCVREFFIQIDRWITRTTFYLRSRNERMP